MRKIFITSTGMSVWSISRRGISLNEGGRWLTFNFIRLIEGDKRGQWLLRFYFKPFLIKREYVFEAFIGTRIMLCK
jgi:hypothetical protein